MNSVLFDGFVLSSVLKRAAPGCLELYWALGGVGAEGVLWGFVKRVAPAKARLKPAQNAEEIEGKIKGTIEGTIKGKIKGTIKGMIIAEIIAKIVVQSITLASGGRGSIIFGNGSFVRTPFINLNSWFAGFFVTYRR